MAQKTEEERILGVFWGQHRISFVETMGEKPQSVFSVQVTEPEEEGPADGEEEEETVEDTVDEGGSKEEKKVVLSPSEQDTFKTVRKTLKKKKMTSAVANLSLPPKDIIFRSFTLPWMPASEVKGVVEFESSKYVPFPLEELIYTYHSNPIVLEDSKRLRIIFVAIRKDTINKYVKILEDASLEVMHIEPSPLSLIRALTLKNFIASDQTIALVEYEGDSGKIIIVDNGIPLFVREFQLKIQADAEPEEGPDEETMRTRLTNEIKISLDYFSRQESHMTIEEIVFLATSDIAEISRDIESALEITTTPMENEALLEIYAEKEADFLNAFGAGLTETVSLPVEFNLGKKTRRRKKKEPRFAAARQINFKSMIVTVLVCVPVIALVLFLTNAMVSGPQQKLAELDQDLGPHSDVEQLSVEKDNIQIDRKLKHLKNVRINSDVTRFLTVIPTLMPDGTWLKDLNIAYIDPEAEQDIRRSRAKKKKLVEKKISKPRLQLTGYAYLENTKEQFRLINNFINNLKEDETFTETFESITLEKVDTQKIEDYDVTFFEIECE